MARKNKSSADTFTTISGKTMSRKQLQNLVSKANYKVEHAKHLSDKEHADLKKRYSAEAKSLGSSGGKLSIKGVTDKRKLRAIEAAARKTLGSAYVQKTKYKELEEKRYQHFLKTGFVKDRDEYELIKDITRTDEWAEMTSTASPYEFFQALQDEVLAEGQKDDRIIQAFRDVIAGFKRLENNEEVSPVINTGTWEDFESTAMTLEYGSWYTDEESNNYFVPNITPEEWEEADMEERAHFITTALAEILR